MDHEYGVMADQIVSDMGPVFAITQEEAQMLARFRFPSEINEVIESAANALYRSYSSEQWGDPPCKTCPVCSRLVTRRRRRGPKHGGPDDSPERHARRRPVHRTVRGARGGQQGDNGRRQDRTQSPRLLPARMRRHRVGDRRAVRRHGRVQ